MKTVITPYSIKAELDWKVECRADLPLIGEYRGPDDYILKHGRAFVSHEPTEKVLEVVKILRSMGPWPRKVCWGNSQRAAMAMDLRTDIQLEYIEGYAACGFWGIDHAWLAVDDCVIDLTWGPHVNIRRGKGTYERRTGPVVGILPEGWEYYGVPISKDEMWDMMMAHRLHDSVLFDWVCKWPLLTGKGHKKANEEA
ncbi:MAG: hypothetical protein Q8R28_15045 [Dehalococcoidia bacterium]|nr:hypothetical protein [Dehalococcoidia bacterium]